MKHLLFLLIAFFCFSAEGQQIEYVDFKTVNSRLVIVPDSTKVSGRVIYSFEILNDTDSIYLDAINMKFKNVFLNDEKVEFQNDLKKIWFKSKFEKNEVYRLVFNYKAYPKKAMYFVKRNEDWQIWTQGQGKYTSNWLPSIDDMNDKIEFDFSIITDLDSEVVANGELIKSEGSANISIRHFNMQKPMSSYLVALAIGKYNKKELSSNSGIPIELYYYPQDSAKVEPTYRYTKQMFDFLEEEIGVPYPWQNYKQVPVKDFLYSGMENTSLTIFSDDFMIDETSFVDKNYVNVNAHELAHQWFGDLVTETEGKHHWLQEGFATYYALLAERDIFGEDYYYWRLYEYAQELLAQEEAEQATALLDPKASSTTFYKKGALVLHMLKEKVGEKYFKKAVKKYLNKFQFKNVETQDFITEVEKASGQDLAAFQEKWLTSNVLPFDEIESHLASVSNTVNGYLKIDCEGFSSKCSAYLTSDIFDESKIKVVSQMPNKIQSKDFKNSIKVRQAIAQNLREIPSALKTEYETLLNDKSYVTIEAALYHLWVNFPEDRKKYLEQTKSIYGFNDYNVRTLWLVLATASGDYEEVRVIEFLKELVSYTSSENGFQRRQNAFIALDRLVFNDEALENLIEATKHHNWRFKSFAKKLLETLSNDEKYKSRISTLQAEEQD